jgi:multicomponent Na+:H+ antiporter subunit D
MLSSLLNVAYLIPIVTRAFFRPPPDAEPGKPVAIAEAPLFCVVPVCVTAFGCLLLFFYADTIMHFITLIDLEGTAAGKTAALVPEAFTQTSVGGPAHVQ